MSALWAFLLTQPHLTGDSDRQVAAGGTLLHYYVADREPGLVLAK